MQRITAILMMTTIAISAAARGEEPGKRSMLLPFPLCDIQGTWVGSAPPFLPELGDHGLILTETVAPFNFFRRELAAVLHPYNPEFSFGGLFPEATAGSPDAYGVYSPVSRKEYGFTFRVYFVKAPPEGLPIRGEVQYWIVIRGTAQCLDENTKLLSTVSSVYSNVENPDLVVPELGINGIHDQDRDDDGFEDPGEEPILSAPLPMLFKRIQVEPAPPLVMP